MIILNQLYFIFETLRQYSQKEKFFYKRIREETKEYLLLNEMNSLFIKEISFGKFVERPIYFNYLLHKTKCIDTPFTRVFLTYLFLRIRINLTHEQNHTFSLKNNIIIRYWLKHEK